ncbi:phage portal protein [Dysgonomonas sp. GY75]|uniref:phage portal protein n=1 Tax=Dysgonomonas sp. GY75 TaxID=2780419 RepID=UPI0018839BA6|nr:phage portal protein [Dysgonomonas sp. GY75]MBF0651284.1 phage portal protein [Dysgonomonas sp. GY75]
MNILGFEIDIRRKSMELPDENTQVVTKTQRILNIEDILPIFEPSVIHKNLVTLFHETAEIYHPVSMITDRCLNAKITLKEYKTDSEIWNNDKINKFLEHPNALNSFRDFMSNLLKYYLVTGNAYITSDLDGYKTTDLWKYANSYHILPSQAVDIKLRNNGRIDLFRFDKISDIIQSYDVKLNGQSVSFPADSVLHIKESNLYTNKNILKGISKLDACKMPIANLIAQYEARNVIYLKRGPLGAIVTKNKDDSGYTIPLLDSQKKDINNVVNENYGLKHYKDQLLFLDKEVEFVKFSADIKDLQPHEEHLSTTIVIGSAYSIPRDLLINKDKSTYANQAGSEKSLYENVCIPLTNKCLSSISNWLGLTGNGLYLNADFSDIPCLQENKKEQATTFSLNTRSYTQLYNENAITYNEMRVGLGYESVKGMDKYKKDIEKENGTEEEHNIQNQNA